ncbi:hypothetical protein ACIBQ1_48030 [Nonomuraea sp. NPDC050153]|uniref:hypothetical protein n=1 Tax=Nonomuraea sp. NPDC050153 TaxID=3364359 RepID=UPI0037A246C6
MSAADVITDVAAADLSRATGAGLDLYEYQCVTSELTDLGQWGETFMRGAHGHMVRAGQAATTISAGERFQMAARWIPRNSQSPPNAVEIASSETLGCAPYSSGIGTGPATTWLHRVPKPSTPTSTTSPTSADIWVPRRSADIYGNNGYGELMA